MKKIILVVCFIFCLLLTGCNNISNKVAKTINDFNLEANNNGYNTKDNMDSYLDIDYIKEASKATSDDIIIEMIIYDNSDNASKAQNSQIDSFKTIKSTAATEHKEKGNNYYKFWMISNGYYMVSSRIDNTLIFSKTLLQNKEKVETLLNNMEY